MDENLCEPPAAGVMAHLLEQFVAQEIIHERLLPGAAYSPIRVCRQTEDRHVLVVAKLILHFHPVRFLGKAGGSLSENLKVAEPYVVRSATQGTASALRVKDQEVAVSPCPAGRNAVEDSGAAIQHQ